LGGERGRCLGEEGGTVGKRKGGCFGTLKNGQRDGQ